jgi:hypothetical protein
MRRLVEHERLQDTPMGLLARLREIDPEVEFLHAMDDLWWLGAVKTDGPGRVIRRAKGERILAAEAKRTQPNPRNVLLGKLLVQGFVLIARYTCKGDPEVGPVYDPEGYECNVVQDFAERDAAWRRDQGEAAAQRRLGAADAHRAAQNATMLDMLHTDGRDAFDRSLRQRVTFGYGR